MKKLLPLLFILAACHNEESKYTVRITKQVTNASGGLDNKVEEETIYAKSDSAAYVEGSIKFATDKMTYEAMKESGNNSNPVSFTVYDQKGVDIKTRVNPRIVEAGEKTLNEALDVYDSATKAGSAELDSTAY